MTWKSKLLSQFPEIAHGSTSKPQGVIAFGHADDEEVIRNREKQCSDLGFGLDQVVMAYQLHTNDVLKVDADKMGAGAYEKESWLGPADALITDQTGPVLIVRTADCVPVFFYHPEKKVAAVAHAGWEGTVKNIVRSVVGVFVEDYDCSAEDIFVAIGPSLCGKDYDVSTVEDNRVERFEKLFGKDPDVIIRDDAKVALDLKKANKKLLLQAGITNDNIETCDICTYEQSDQWASYRKDPGNLAYSIWSFITLRK